MERIVAISVTFTTQPQENAGTADPLYLGVYTSHSGREFPLRHQQAVPVFERDTRYEFAFKANDPNQAYLAGEGQYNNPNSTPIKINPPLPRVYIRKEATNPTGISDDALGISTAVVIIDADPTTGLEWNNRLEPGIPTPFWLGSEFGQIFYLRKE